MRYLTRCIMPIRLPIRTKNRCVFLLIVKRRAKLGISLEAGKIGPKNPEKRMPMIQRSKQLLSLLVSLMCEGTHGRSFLVNPMRRLTLWWIVWSRGGMTMLISIRTWRNSLSMWIMVGRLNWRLSLDHFLDLSDVVQIQ